MKVNRIIAIDDQQLKLTIGHYDNNIFSFHNKIHRWNISDPRLFQELVKTISYYPTTEPIKTTTTETTLATLATIALLALAILISMLTIN